MTADSKDGPRAARDVPPGAPWSFKEHRSMAEIMREEHERLRRRLPNRRMAMTTKIEHRGHVLHLTCGWSDPSHDDVAEIFVSGGKEGTDLRHTLADAATIISIALQHGVPLADLARSVARVDGKPASAIGAVLDAALAEEERAA